MNEFEKQSVVVALKKMFTGGYFSICTIETCAKVIGCHIPSDIHNTLHALHCVNWSDMTPPFREEVKQKVLSALSTPILDLSTIDVYFSAIEQIEDTKTEKKRLFGLLK
jgi:hypothetical protein